MQYLAPKVTKNPKKREPALTPSRLRVKYLI